MSLFKTIMSKIFGSSEAKADSPAPTPVPATPAATIGSPQPVSPGPVDVEAVLVALAARKGGGGNWRTSIVDLLKLLDLDSSLTARKQLAEELGVNAGPHGSAEQNIALQKAVWRTLAQNGGQVPAALRD